MTFETTRMSSEEVTNQVSRGLNEIMSILNSQIQDAISTAIAEKVLPSFLKYTRYAGETTREPWSRKSPIIMRKLPQIGPHTQESETSV